MDSRQDPLYSKEARTNKTVYLRCPPILLEHPFSTHPILLNLVSLQHIQLIIIFLLHLDIGLDLGFDQKVFRCLPTEEYHIFIV